MAATGRSTELGTSSRARRCVASPITWASSGARCATGSTCSGLAGRPPLMARRPAAPSSPPAPRPARCRRRAVRRGPLEGQTPEQRIAGLKSRVAELEAETTKLTTEREASLVDPLAFIVLPSTLLRTTASLMLQPLSDKLGRYVDVLIGAMPGGRRQRRPGRTDLGRCFGRVLPRRFRSSAPLGAPAVRVGLSSTSRSRERSHGLSASWWSRRSSRKAPSCRQVVFIRKAEQVRVLGVPFNIIVEMERPVVIGVCVAALLRCCVAPGASGSLPPLPGPTGSR